MRRVRHQQGSLQREKRQRTGETVWVFRWYEIQLDGTKRYRKAVIGTVEEFKTEAEAQRAADALPLEINEQTPRQKLQAIRFETLVDQRSGGSGPRRIPFGMCGRVRSVPEFLRS
jgi:hypothetical protein